MDQEIGAIASGMVGFGIAIVVQGIADLSRCIGFGWAMNSQIVGGALGATPRANPDSTTSSYAGYGGPIEKGGGEIFVFLGIAIVVETVAMDFRSRLIIGGMVPVLRVGACLPYTGHAESRGLVGTAADPALVFTTLEVMD